MNNSHATDAMDSTSNNPDDTAIVAHDMTEDATSPLTIHSPTTGTADGDVEEEEDHNAQIGGMTSFLGEGDENEDDPKKNKSDEDEDEEDEEGTPKMQVTKSKGGQGDDHDHKKKDKSDEDEDEGSHDHGRDKNDKNDGLEEEEAAAQRKRGDEEEQVVQEGLLQESPNQPPLSLLCQHGCSTVW